MDSGPLAGKRILLSGNDRGLSLTLRDALLAAGAEINGANLSFSQSGEISQKFVDGAIVTLDFGDPGAFDLADRLQRAGVAVVLATDYHPFVIPRRFADLPLCPTAAADTDYVALLIKLLAVPSVLATAA